MADLTVQIPAPTLTTGQYFKVRYRQLPGGAWSAYTNRSNISFTITGLSEGDYQLEFILVNADGAECTAVYRTYTIVTDYQCISFNSQLVEVAGLYHIEVTYTLPQVFTDPNCGWEIEWLPVNGAASKIPYTALPTSGIIKIPTANDGGVFRINALMCNGRSKQCHVNDILKISAPPCTSMTNLNADIVEEQDANGVCSYYMVITFTQSNPPTTSLHLDISQWGQAGLNPDRWKGYKSISSTSTMVKHKLNPTMASGQEEMEYALFVTDICKGTHARIYKTFYRTKCFNQLP